jgi:hypothetical protein
MWPAVSVANLATVAAGGSEVEVGRHLSRVFIIRLCLTNTYGAAWPIVPWLWVHTEFYVTLFAFRTVKFAMKRWRMNETNRVSLFCTAFIYTYYCFALQWFLFHDERDAVLKFNRMSFYVTRTLFWVPYKLVKRSLHHITGVIGTQSNITILW